MSHEVEGIQTPCETLSDILSRRSMSQGHAVAYRWLAQRDFHSSEELTYRELDLRARAIASLLTRNGENSPVLLFYPPGLAYITAFFGCLYAGRIAVPLYPPRRNRKLARVTAAILDSGAGTALTIAELLPTIAALKASVSALASLDLMTAEDLCPDPKGQTARPGPDDIAFLQYTSGSTGDPKGVMVTHGNLIANQQAIGSAFATHAQDHCLSWLPLYHDMGLIGSVLHPLFNGIPATLMSPATFIGDPLFWLEAISYYKATLAGAPNFAYDLCVDGATAQHLAKLDLSSWQVAFNGAEPVQAKTMRRFADTFQTAGFKAASFFPCYGMAEATLFISGAGRGQFTRTHHIQCDALQHRQAKRAEPDEKCLELVGCGTSVADHCIRIVDPDSGITCPKGAVGEIWFSGPSVANGYWQRPELSRAIFHATLADDPKRRYLRTGDLGFEYEGQLFITSRLKDLIVIRGRNYFPSDVERVMETCHEAANTGGGAAFSVAFEGTEQLVLIQEVAHKHLRHVDRESMLRTIREAVAEALEIQAHMVLLVKPGGIPKTSSGKVRRAACKQAFLDGSLPLLRVDSRPVAPSAESETSGPQAQLRAWLATHLGCNADEIDPQRALTAMGLDSIIAIKLQHHLASQFKLRVSMDALLGGSSLNHLLSEASPAEPLPHPSTPSEKSFPLSQAQTALWYLHELQGEGAAYNLAFAFLADSRFSPDVFERSFQQLMQTHPMLCTRFRETDGKLEQIVDSAASLPFFHVDARQWDDSALKTFLEKESAYWFDLAHELAYRVSVLAREDETWVICFTGHHIAFDFWSFGILLRQLSEGYAAGGHAIFPPPRQDYSAFQQYQQGLVTSSDGEGLRAFWHNRLHAPLPLLELPLDYLRPLRQRFRGERLHGALGPRVTEELRSMAQAKQCTLFNVVFGIFATLLQRYSGQKDLLLGTPSHGRDHFAFEDIVGYFVNPLVTRFDFSKLKDSDALLDFLHRATLEAQTHGAYPFNLLVKELQRERDPSRSALFSAMFVWHTAAQDSALPALALRLHGTSTTLGDTRLTLIDEGQRTAQFDLTLHAAMIDGEIALTLEYDSDLFTATSATRMLRALETLAGQFNSSCALSRLAIMSPGQLKYLLHDLNHRGGGLEMQPLEALLQRHLHPDATAIALESANETWTYGQLTRAAAGVAQALIERGMGPGQVVGVCMLREPRLMAALVGVLMSGAAYLPLDPAYPQRRLHDVVKDAKPSCILVTDATRAGFAELEIALYDFSGQRSLFQSWGSSCPQQLSHIIYTSGSTGKPKGVAVTRRNTAALLIWAASEFSDLCLTGVLASTAISFDLSVFEIFFPISRGGRTVLVESLLTLAEGESLTNITLINTVPSVMQELLNLEALPASTRVICLAGEALPASLAQRLRRDHPQIAVFNLYGPSEDTTYSTYARINDAELALPSIGRPLRGTAAYLLDDDLNPVPFRAIGELFLSGNGVAQGYYHNARFTAQSFLPNPFADADQAGSRMYRSGDLARYREDGALIFLGRRDLMIKLRGFRIEIEEIEQVMDAFPGVRRSVVVVAPDAAAYLLAFFTYSDSVDTGALETYLKARLPHYMVPARLIALASFPLTASGKVDRRALAMMKPPSMTEAPEHLSDTELQLAELWHEILGVRPQRASDDFFALGGHSLAATRLVSRAAAVFSRSIKLSQVLACPTLEQQATLFQGATQAVARQSIPRADATRTAAGLPLSFAQQRLWVLNGMPGAQIAYLMPAAFEMTGPLDCIRLERALTEVLREHQGLRTHFHTQNGHPRQRVRPLDPFRLSLLDISAFAPHALDAEVARLLKRASRQPMFLDRGPLYRFQLIRLGERRHLLHGVFHHIVADGASISLLFETLKRQYAHLSATAASEAPLYGDFAAWEQDGGKDLAIEEGLVFWEAHLAGAPEQTTPPSDFPRPPMFSFAGEQLTFSLDVTQTGRLTELSRCLGLTMHMSLLAVYAALLSRYCNQNDLVIGVPVANRERDSLAGVIGFFVNTLPIRLQLERATTFVSLLKVVRDLLLEAYHHQGVPFDSLVNQLKPARDASSSPFFQTLFLLEEAEPQFCLEGVAVAPMPLHTGTAKFDLSLALKKQADGFSGTLEYATSLYKPVFAQHFAAHFQVLLCALLDAPHQPLAQCSLLSDQERQRLLDDLSGARVQVCSELPVALTLFEAMAKRNPTATAVFEPGRRLSYCDLNRRANGLANLMSQRGLGTGAIVALCLRRSEVMLAAVLATHKTGAMYLPLDPNYPCERLAFMLSDAGASAVVCDEVTRAQLPQDDRSRLVLELSDLLESDTGHRTVTTSQSRSHLIYTSGSTGRPKGVVVRHSGVSRLMSWARQTYTDEDLAHVFFATSLCFDLSVFEIFAPLCHGGTVVVAENIFDLAQPELGKQVTLVNTVPSAINELVAMRVDAPNLRIINLAGEALNAMTAAKVHQYFDRHVKLFNLYGPTEDTTYSTWSLVPEGELRPSIGRPLGGTRAYVLDAFLAPVPSGIQGMLFLAGQGLAEGYFKRAGRTASAYLPDPFHGLGQRMYATGDLVLFLEDGALRYLGRADGQIKLRGFRIELGEIERALMACPQVTSALAMVLKRSPANDLLTAYVVLSPDQSWERLDLAAQLRDRLPSYMVPQAFIRLEAIPLTPNGKVDRGALPLPNLATAAQALPKTPLEHALAKVWSEVLALEHLDTGANFFELGGDSLAAMRVLGMVGDRFQVSLSLAQFFQNPTIATLAARILAAEQVEILAPEPRAGSARIALTPAQEAMFFLDRARPDARPMYTISTYLDLNGPLHLDALDQAASLLKERHESLRTSFHMEGESLYQQVHPHGHTPLTLIDLSVQDEPSLAQLTASLSQVPFDPVNGHLVRIQVLRLSPLRHRLLVSMHHIIADGWSLSVLAAELTASYDLFLRQNCALPRGELQYGDYAAWLQRRRAQVSYRMGLEFWLNYLEDAPPLMALPTDFPRPANIDHRGGSLPLRFERALLSSLRRVCDAQGISLFMLLQATFAALLQRYANQDDVVVGVPSAGRNHPRLEKLIGLFVNTLPLRFNLAGDPLFTEVLKRVKTSLLSAMAHEDIPFEQIVSQLKHERSRSHHPVFQVMLTLQNVPFEPMHMPGLEVRVGVPPVRWAKVDLSLNLRLEDALIGEIHYRKDLFKPSTVTRIATHFRKLLTELEKGLDLPLSRLPLLSQEERAAILYGWNATSAAPSGDLMEWYRSWTKLLPDAPALVEAPSPGASHAMSYAQLDRAVRALTRLLLARGVGPERGVVLVMERSTDMIVAILAVLHAGGYFIPLEPSQPVERLRALTVAANPYLILVRGGWRLPEVGVTQLDLGELALDLLESAIPKVIPHPQQAAYQIFTSGSTGMPKGVLISRDAISHYCGGLGQNMQLQPRLNYALASTLSADLGLTMVFPALTHGGCLHVLSPEQVTQPSSFSAYMQDQRIDYLKIVPSHLAALRADALDDRCLPQKLLVLGGEAAEQDLIQGIQHHAPNLAILNHYGPTETTVGALTCPIEKDTDKHIPLGRPLPGMRAHVLSPALEPVPIGVIGEIHLGGPGVARGYQDRPSQTAALFIPDPFAQNPGERLYKTGDLGRYREDGLLIFLGRRDDQAKIRGFRIELKEIEVALAALPNVREVLVLLEETQHSLVAYLVSSTQLELDRLRQTLAERLPAYMLPQHMIQLERMPLSANGKILRSALPSPQPCEPSPQGQLPSGRVEIGLAEIWADLFKRDDVAANDDFFELGGHSLSAIRLLARIRMHFGCELQLATVFAAPRLRDLAKVIATASPEVMPILPRGHQEPIALAFSQQRLWFLERFEAEPGLYNMLSSLSLQGPFDAAALERSLSCIVSRHEALRTVFLDRDGVPCMAVKPARGIQVLMVDLGPSGLLREKLAAQLQKRETSRPFHLEADLMMRVLLLRLGPQEHQLLLTLHHLVADAWSMECLVAEFFELYAAFVAEKEAVLPQLPVQYGDYALWQKGRLTGSHLEALRHYWASQLKGCTELLDLPCDLSRPAQQTFKGKLWVHPVASATYAQLASQGREQGATPFMALQAAFAVLLSRYSNQNDILIGSPIANRNFREVEPLIGFFLNTLVLRNDLSGAPSTQALLAQTRAMVLAAFAHGDLPLEQIVGAVGPKRDLSHSPLFQVMFVFQDAPMNERHAAGVRFTPQVVDRGISRFDLTLNCQLRHDGLLTFWEYNEALFLGETVARMAANFDFLLGQMAANPLVPVQQLAVVDDAQKHLLLTQWNSNQAYKPCLSSLAEILAKAKGRSPHVLAVTCSQGRLTYAELDDEANRLAHYLLARGVKSEDLVGVLAARSHRILPLLLAILKTGAAYVPLDPAFPQERIRYMLEDAGISMLVGDGALLADYAQKGRHLIALDQQADLIAMQSSEFPLPQINSAQIAYTIYTSGSTGKPKGVQISHYSVLCLLQALHSVVGLKPRQRFLALTTISFDISVLELFLPLSVGAECVIASERVIADPGELLTLLASTHFVQATPATWRLVQQAEIALPQQLVILSGGEALPHDLAAYLLTQVDRLINLYGPTETTVWSGALTLKASDLGHIGNPIPIGSALDNERFHILDPYLQPVPRGVVGQIWIAGDGLARGYLRRPSLTAERFVPDPFAPRFSASIGARLYRSGDLGRYLPDGRIAFMGRIDHQVKLHGFRIELGEVEAALGAHPAVGQAIANLYHFSNGDTRLTAYLVLTGASSQEPTAQDLRHFLKQTLPDYMVPSLFMFLEALPRTPNGKLDKRALPKPMPQQREAVTPPRDIYESILADIWKEVLQMDEVSVYDDFFQLGGHSLLAVKMQSRLNESLNLELSLKLLFEASVLSDQAALIRGLDSAALLQSGQEVHAWGDHEEIIL